MKLGILDLDDLTSQCLPKFSRVIDVVKQDLGTIRTGKASPQLVENLIVDAYGSKMRLLELATIVASDPTTLVVTPFDVSNTGVIANAVTQANLGLTATPEDTKVRIIVPPLSQERREEYVKLARTKVEGGKVMVRQVRHDAMEDISHSNLDEDSQRRMEKELQVLTDKMVAELETLADVKEKELLSL